MSTLPVSYLIGNPSLEETDAPCDDAGVRPSALPDDSNLEREMAEAFGWDVPPTEDELERDYAAHQCDEAELLAKYPGLHNQPDAVLIDLIADPQRLISDADEVAAVAAILLARRLSNATA